MRLALLGAPRLKQTAWLDHNGREIARREMEPDRPGVYPCTKDEKDRARLRRHDLPMSGAD